MKLFINNKTNLSMGEIGRIFDDYISDDDEKTFFDGHVDKVMLGKGNQEYIMEITYHIRQLSIVVDELSVRAKEIYTKDLKLPKLPKVKNEKF